MSNELLKKAFSFKDADLNANRQSLLSKSQRLSLERDANTYGVIIITIIALIALISVSMILITLIRADIVLSQTITILVLIYCITGVFIYVLFVPYNRLRETLADGYVDSIEGNIQLYRRKKSKGFGYYYLICIGDKCFTVFQKQYEVMTDGFVYIIYFAPQNTILSLEILN